jgi:hypothetical protein
MIWWEGFLAMNEQPWMRQPDEPTKAYSGFLQYLFLPPSERSIARAAEDQEGDKTTVKPRQKFGKKTAKIRQFETWSAKFDWVARVNAFDDHQAAQAFVYQQEAVSALAIKRAQAQERFLENEQRIADLFLKKLEQMLSFPLVEEVIKDRYPDGLPHVTIVKAVGWNFGTVARMARVFDHLGRAALGLPQANQTDINEVAGVAVDRILAAAKVALKPEELNALLEELARQNRDSGSSKNRFGI